MDHGMAAQRAAEEHLDACWEAYWLQEVDGDEDVISPAVGAFCGCQTCMVREVLYAAYPHLKDAVLEHLRPLAHACDKGGPCMVMCSPEVKQLLAD